MPAAPADPDMGAAASGGLRRPGTVEVARSVSAQRAPRGVVVAKGDDDLPPHNALRSCHGTPEVNGCAVSLHAGPRGPPLR